MPAFARGMELGARAYQAGIDARETSRRTDIAEREMAERERDGVDRRLDAEIDRKRKGQLAEQYRLEIEEKKAEAARFVEASAAFDKFSAAMDLIDQGAPGALDSYGRITKQYLPSILKHDAVMRKWEATDRVFKQGQAFTIKRMADAGTLRAVQELAEIAPEIMANPPRRPDGTPDFEAVRSIVQERRKELAQEQMDLRGAAVKARAEAEREGAYGGRTANDPRKVSSSALGPVEKAELDATAAELKAVNEELLKFNLANLDRPLDKDPGTAGALVGAELKTPKANRKLFLLNRKGELQRKLRKLATPDAPAPAAEPVSTAGEEGRTVIGEWTVTPLE